MRLLFVHNVPPWHPRAGGGQQVNHRIAAAAAARHDVRVLYLGTGDGAPSTAYATEWVNEHRRLTVNAVRIAHAARKLARRWRPEVVHGSAAEAGLIVGALPGSVGIVATSHHPDPPPLLPADWSLIHPLHALGRVRALQAPLLEARLLRGAHRVVAISAWSARILRERGYLRGDEPVAVVPNPVDDMWLEPHARRGRTGPARVLFAGRLEPAKGADLLLRALTAGLADVELRIAGAGPDERELRALASALGVEARVAFLGRLSEEQLLAEMGAASALALPSRAENYPLVPLEAMAAGVPVVATTVGGVPELIADGRSGLLVPPEDVGALVHALDRALRDQQLRERLVAGGRARAEEHRAARLVERLEVEYHLARELALEIAPAPRRRLSNAYREASARLASARAPRASGRPAPERAGRVAVVRPGRLGDLLLADPLLDALERDHPGSWVELITDAADLVPPWMLDDPGRVHRTIALRRSPASAGWRRPGDPALRDSLARIEEAWRQDPPDILLFAVGLDDPVMRWLAAQLSRAAPRAWKAGLVAAGQRPRELDRAVEPSSDPAHEIERLLTLADTVGAPSAFRLPRLPAAGDEPAVLPLWNGPTVVLHPGASLPSKQWPLPRWGQVAARLRARGVRVVVVGGPEERSRLPALGIEFDERTALDRVGGLDLTRLARAIGAADAFVGNDSFPFHLAAAAGIPALVLVGPGAARWTSYPVPHVTVLRDPVPCSPRAGGECPVYATCPHGACMQNIRVSDVVAALSARLPAQEGAGSTR